MRSRGRLPFARRVTRCRAGPLSGVTALVFAVGMAACMSRPPETSRTFAACEGSDTAAEVVNAFWSELDRNYAVFPYRLSGRSWDDVGRAACESIADARSPEAVFDALVGMAEALDDGHIQIRAPDLGRRATGWVGEYPLGALMDSVLPNVVARYLDGPLAQGAEGHIAWGRIGSVGYLHLWDFEGLSPAGTEEADTEAARIAMATAARDLRGADGVVVDLRNNEGGWDEVGLEVARWFEGPRALTYTIGRRTGPGRDSVGDWEAVHVEASPPEGITTPTVVLVSGWTFSAAETFALSMRVRSRVTVMGERTYGHLSDLEPAALPNGWRYTYSAQRYRAADGQVYEERGVPVDVPLQFDTAAFRSGRDTMLEAAIEHLLAAVEPPRPRGR